ncbi:MAG TPA: hypothetical protein VF960_06485 [Chloroflexota bacterium]
MPAVKCLSCQHLETVAGTGKNRCDLGKFDRPTRGGAYKGSYSITSLAMGTPFLRQVAEKCGDQTPR